MYQQETDIARHAGGTPGRKQDGVVLIISMVFLAVFVALGVALMSLSDMHAQAANNFQQGYRARYCAESGLETMRYWLSQVRFSEAVDPNQRIEAVAASLQTVLTNHGITNVQMSATDTQLSVADVYLDAAQQDRFQAVLMENDGQTLPLYVYGTHAGGIQRKIRVDFTIGSASSSIFDYGVASKGPLAMTGNVSLCGVNDDSEADTYIESMNEVIALTLTGNGDIAGDVQIANANATVDMNGGNATIGGESGQAPLRRRRVFRPALPWSVKWAVILSRNNTASLFNHEAHCMACARSQVLPRAGSRRLLKSPRRQEKSTDSRSFTTKTRRHQEAHAGMQPCSRYWCAAVPVGPFPYVCAFVRNPWVWVHVFSGQKI